MQQFDEMCLEHPRNNTPALCVAIREKYEGHSPTLFFYGDASGNRRDTRGAETDYTIVGRELKMFLVHGSDRTERRNPPVLRRRDFINDIFAGKTPGITLSIGEHCRNQVNDMLNLKEDANGHKLKEKAKDPHSGITYEKYGHCSDTLDYITTAIFRREFERFCGK